MYQQDNKHKSDQVFSIEVHVYLKLQPYMQLSLKLHGFYKLLPKFYGPFPILDHIGSVAYQLQLPPNAAIHNVFHVSQLKLCLNPHNQPIQHLSATNVDAGKIYVAILDRKMVKQGRFNGRINQQVRPLENSIMT